jgi:hypothetical protein
METEIGAAGLPATVERDGENLFVVYEAAADYPADVRPRVKLDPHSRCWNGVAPAPGPDVGMQMLSLGGFLANGAGATRIWP